MSDVPAERMPRGPIELAAGVTQLRLWGMNRAGAMSADEIARAAREAGFNDVRAELCGDRVIDPALRWARKRLARRDGSAPTSQLASARLLLKQVELLRDRGILEYLLLRATSD